MIKNTHKTGEDNVQPQNKIEDKDQKTMRIHTIRYQVLIQKYPN